MFSGHFSTVRPFLNPVALVSWIEAPFVRRTYFFVTVRIFLLTFICGSFILQPESHS